MKSSFKKASCINPLKQQKLKKLSLLGIVMLVAAAQPASAATETWITGSGGTANWNTAGNWTGTNLPPIAADSLAFGATTGVTTLNNDYTAGFSFGAITFNAGASAYTIGGNGISLGGNIGNNSTATQIINIGLDMTAARTVNTLGGGGDVKLGGLLSGTGGSITKGANLGTLTINGSVSNTYTGATNVNGGTLLIDFANMTTATNLIAATSSVTMGGGILNIKGNAGLTTSQTFGALGQTGSTYNNIVVNPNGNGSTTVNFGALSHAAGAVTVFDISGTGAGVTTTSTNTNGLLNTGYLVKDASGTGFATKSGSNVVRYDDTTGTTLSSTATTSTVNYTTLASGSSVTMASGNQSLNSLAVDTTSGAQAIDLNTGIKTVTSLGVLFRGSNNATISNGQLGANNAETIVHQLGTGKLTVSGTVGSGTASLTKDGTGELALAGANTYTGATRVLDGTLTVNNTLGATAVSVGSTVNTTGINPTFNLGAGSAMTAGSISILNPNAIVNVTQANALGNAVTLTLTAGTLNLNAAQTRTGTITVNGGFTLGIGDDAALGSTNLVLGGGTVVANGAHVISNTFEQGNANTVIGGTSALTFNGVFTNKGSATLTINNTALTTFGTGGIILRDTGTAQRSLALNGTGNVAITGPIVNGTTLNGIMTYNGVNSTTTVSGANTYSGNTAIGAASTATTVKLGSATALGFGGASAVAGTTVVAAGSTLDLGGQTVNEPITINGTGVSGAGSLINSNTSTTAVIDNGLAAVGSGIAGAGYTDGTYSLTITGGGGTGAAATAIVAGGIVTSVQVTNAGTGFTSAPVVTLVGAGTPSTVATFTPLTSTLVMGSASTVGGAGNITVNGAITGNQALTKIGAGTLTIAGPAALGANVITAGTLLVDGTATATSYSLGSATLGGSSSTTGLVTTGGTTSHLAPGATSGAIGTLTLTTGLNAANGASFDLQLGTSSDVLTVGALTGSTAAGGLVFNISGAAGFAGGVTYTLLNFTTTTGLDYSDLFASAPAGYSLDTSFGTGGFLINANNLQVQFVPEPSTYALLIGGISFLFVLRRKFKKIV